MKKYRLPQDMVDYVRSVRTTSEDADIAVEGALAAVRWQSENPPVPTIVQASRIQTALIAKKYEGGSMHFLADICREWVQTMYPSTWEPDPPTGLDDLGETFTLVTESGVEIRVRRVE